MDREQSQCLLDEAAAHGFNASRTAVAALIDTAVTRAAIRAGVTHRAAQKNYSDDVRTLVRGAADSLAAEAPGTQLADLRPTHTVPVALAGRTASGLAILTELAASAAGPDRRELVHGLNQALSLITEWGVVIEEAATTTHQHHVAVPEAAIHRTIREFERGGYHLAAGITPLDGGDPDSLAQAFDHNIAELRREL